MTTKSLLIAATLTFTSLAFAGAKSYDFSISSPTKMGTTDLKPGQYQVKVDGTQATIRDAQTGKSFTVPVRVEHGSQKFDQTTVQSSTKDGVDRITEINLGGSDTRLELGDL